MLAASEIEDSRGVLVRETPVGYGERGPLDIDAAQELSGLGWSWARSYGLVERPEQDCRLVVLHAARLLTALDLDLEVNLRALLLHLTTWLTMAERTGEGPLLADYLVGDGTHSKHFGRAAADLRHRSGALGLDVSCLVAVAQEQEHGFERNEPVEDQTRRWMMVVLEELGFLHANQMPTIHDIEFTLPAGWAAEVNPLAFRVESDVETWLREVRVIRDERGERIFRDLAVAEYAGWPCPNAGYEELWTMTGFFTLWIFHDDVLEGIGASSDEVLASAVSGMLEVDDPALNNPYVRGWSELGWRLKRKMSDEWLSRHYENFLGWARSVSSEADTLRSFRLAGNVPQVSEYLALRRRTIGMRPTLGFVEYILGEELPSDVSCRPEISAVIDLSADLVAIHNDLLAFSKDLDQRMINLAICRMATGSSGQQAFRDLADLHEKKVERFLAETESLISNVDAHVLPLVQRWISAVQHIIHGFARWHFVAARYSDVHPMSDGSIVRVLLRESAAH